MIQIQTNNITPTAESIAEAEAEENKETDEGQNEKTTRVLQIAPPPKKNIKLLKQKIKLVKQLREFERIKPLQNRITERIFSNQTKKRP